MQQRRKREIRNQHLDKTDLAILERRIERREQFNGPRVGDFCVMRNGEERRFTYHWGDRIQVNMKGISSSFYLDDHGVMDYSGGLDPAIRITTLKLRLADVRDGRCWFCHHDLLRTRACSFLCGPE